MAAPAAGYSEQYTFRINGKVIGKQTAELISLDGDSQRWRYQLDLKVPGGGKTITLLENGIFAVTASGQPLSYETSASLDGQSQKEALTFRTGNVSVILDPPQAAVPGKIAIAGTPFLIANNNLTAWSIISRANRPKTTGVTTWQMFSANALQPVVATLSAMGAETVKIGGQDVACHVYSVFPIGNRFWIADVTGELVKDADPSQKLEIVKE